MKHTMLNKKSLMATLMTMTAITFSIFSANAHASALTPVRGQPIKMKATKPITKTPKLPTAASKDDALMKLVKQKAAQRAKDDPIREFWFQRQLAKAAPPMELKQVAHAPQKQTNGVATNKTRYANAGNGWCWEIKGRVSTRISCNTLTANQLASAVSLKDMQKAANPSAAVIAKNKTTKIHRITMDNEETFTKKGKQIVLTASAENQLNGVVKDLNRPNVKTNVLIEGHTTPFERNAEQISKTHADKVADYIYKRTNRKNTKLMTAGRGGKQSKMRTWCGKTTKEFATKANIGQVSKFNLACHAPDKRIEITITQK